jgi:hypothetical protein
VGCRATYNINLMLSIPEGFTGTALKGHTVVNLQDKLPAEYDYLRYKIEAESGEGMTNSGSAIICIDLEGRLLPKFKQVTGGSGKFSYGFVFVSKPYVEVSVSRHGDDINAEITKITPAFPEPEKKIWWTYNGHEDCASLPEKLEKYESALQVAISKSNCYHCHCLHFYSAPRCNSSGGAYRDSSPFSIVMVTPRCARIDNQVPF